MTKKYNSQTPLVSIVIINYNTAKLTVQSINTICSNTSYSSYELIIIDNASHHKDQIILEEFCKSESLSLHIMEENLGWNRGVNHGFSIANGDLLLTISSDVMVEHNWLNNMVEIYLSEKRVGAVNANIFEDGESIISAKDSYLKVLHGACSMFSSDAWSIVGGLDYQNFTIYGGENDWSYRARSIGYKLLLSEKSIVNHLGSSKINAGGGLSVQKTGNKQKILKVRLKDRFRFRAYNFKLKDWISKQILYEFKEAFKSGYLALLVFSYLKVFSNIKNIYQARRYRYLKMKYGVKILNSIDDN